MNEPVDASPALLVTSDIPVLANKNLFDDKGRLTGPFKDRVQSVWKIAKKTFPQINLRGMYLIGSQGEAANKPESDIDILLFTEEGYFRRNSPESVQIMEFANPGKDVKGMIINNEVLTIPEADKPNFLDIFINDRIAVQKNGQWFYNLVDEKWEWFDKKMEGVI